MTDTAAAAPAMTMTDWGPRRIDRRYWTIAVRKPRANRFLRVDDLALTWDHAMQLAGYVRAFYTVAELQIWVTTTREAEVHGYCCEEDAGNIMVDSGKRVRMFEGGKLENLIPMDTDAPRTRPEPEAIDWDENGEDMPASDELDGPSGPLTATEFIEQVGGPLSAWVAINDAERCMSLEHFERYPDPERTTEHVATHLAELLEGET